MNPSLPPRQHYADPLTRFLHRLVAHPWVYDQVQIAAGARTTTQHLAAQVALLSGASLVLDVGGGTGLYRGLWPESCAYLATDLDIEKLVGFRAKYPNDPALLADASALPLAAGSVDVVLCTFVSHHLPDSVLAAFLAESRRVLRRGGVFLFMDALWVPSRWPGRLLWRFDRGSFPRTATMLTEVIAEHYTLRHQERFAVWHEYMLLVGRKESA
ncbi:MAG: class I SAM-dependent methyltransferase [Ardenticatenales bacterium]|nr:class I SAM-dependent methyltransferase [Ardenticatenales bacterium]